MELERIYGIQKGNNQHSLRDNLVTKTQHELAEEMGIKEKQLQEYKKLTTLIPELKQLT